MLTLDKRSRAAIAGAGLLLYAAAFALAPSGARGAPDESGIVPRRGTVSAAAPAARPYAVLRDPFAGSPDARPPAPTPTPTPSSAFPVERIRPLPPNAGAGLAAAQPLRVPAIVSGDRAMALVDDGTSVRAVAAGDALLGRRITSIDALGVHLSDGTTLRIDDPSRRAQP